MAQRFGGKYSPDGSSDDSPDQRPQQDAPIERGAYHGARPDPVGFRANLLFAPAAVLVFTSLNEGAIGLTLGLIAAALLTLAAWLTRDGLRAEAEYTARTVARRPLLPRKMLGSTLTGLGIALAAYTSAMADGQGAALLSGVLFGAVTGALHMAAFGLDPMKNKGMEGIDLHQQTRVAKAVDQAETYLRSMTDAIQRAGDRQAEARLERFQSKARDLLRTVEEDPRDLTAARKYMGVYLRGARDATVKFADIYSRSQDQGARADYLSLLTDLEDSFDAKTQALLLDNQSDLTIEIEVLRDRLAREGLRPE